jgi:hypothetical protein
VLFLVISGMPYIVMAYQMKPDASRLRQEILRAEEARAPHVRALLSVRDPLRRGSFVVLRRKCGKPTCHCNEGEGHPAKYLSLKESGRTRMIYVGPGEEMAVAEGNGRYRSFREHRAAMAKLSKEVLNLINALEDSLALPSPKPVAVRRSRRKEKGREST